MLVYFLVQEISRYFCLLRKFLASAVTHSALTVPVVTGPPPLRRVDIPFFTIKNIHITCQFNCTKLTTVSWTVKAIIEALTQYARNYFRLSRVYPLVLKRTLTCSTAATTFIGTNRLDLGWDNACKRKKAKHLTGAKSKGRSLSIISTYQVST